jgi:hypothetical protein
MSDSKVKGLIESYPYPKGRSPVKGRPPVKGGSPVKESREDAPIEYNNDNDNDAREDAPTHPFVLKLLEINKSLLDKSKILSDENISLAQKVAFLEDECLALKVANGLLEGDKGIPSNNDDND